MRLLPLVLVLALFAALSTASAQPRQPKPRLRVAVGTASTFLTQLHVESTQEMMGQEVQMNIDATGEATLEVMKVDRDEVTWHYAIPSLNLKIDAPMAPGQSMDTTIAFGPMEIVTDRKGQVVSQGSAGQSDPTFAMLDQAMQGDWAAMMFSPVISQQASVGDTWTEKVSDTSSRDQSSVAGANVGEFVMNRSYTRSYTYEAIVDTLGYTTMRVRSRIDSLEIAGVMEIGQNPLNMAGSGEQEGLAYYDAVTGVLLTGTMNGETNMMLTMGGAMPLTIPMTLRTRYTVHGK